MSGILGALASYKISSGGSLTGSESDGTQLLPTNTGAGDKGFTSDWNALVTSITTASTTAPDGTTSAALITDTTGDTRHIIYYYLGGGLTANTNFTISVYAKQNTRRYLQILIASGVANDKFYGYYDLQAGTVTSTGSIGSGVYGSSSIAAGANGFYKCILTGKTPDTGAIVHFALSDVSTYGSPLASDSPSFADSGSSFYLWRPKVTQP